MVKNINIKPNNTYSYCNEIDPITHFVLDRKSNKHFRKDRASCWHSITGFNIIEEEYIYNNQFDLSFLETAIISIVTNYCMLYVKHYTYLEK